MIAIEGNVVYWPRAASALFLQDRRTVEHIMDLCVKQLFHLFRPDNAIICFPMLRAAEQYSSPFIAAQDKVVRVHLESWGLAMKEVRL